MPDSAFWNGVATSSCSRTVAISRSHAAIVAWAIWHSTPRTTYASAIEPSSRLPISQIRSDPPLCSRAAVNSASEGSAS